MDIERIVNNTGIFYKVSGVGYHRQDGPSYIRYNGEIMFFDKLDPALRFYHGGILSTGHITIIAKGKQAFISHIGEKNELQ